MLERPRPDSGLPLEGCVGKRLAADGSDAGVAPVERLAPQSPPGQEVPSLADRRFNRRGSRDERSPSANAGPNRKNAEGAVGRSHYYNRRSDPPTARLPDLWNSQTGNGAWQPRGAPARGPPATNEMRSLRAGQTTPRGDDGDCLDAGDCVEVQSRIVILGLDPRIHGPKAPCSRGSSVILGFNPQTKDDEGNTGHSALPRPTAWGELSPSGLAFAKPKHRLWDGEGGKGAGRAGLLGRPPSLPLASGRDRQ